MVDGVLGTTNVNVVKDTVGRTAPLVSMHGFLYCRNLKTWKM